ncbi:MAG: hypothetical protein WB992_12540 [Bryobacteraceae bacterium]
MRIPIPILAACGILVLLFFIFLVRMLRETSKTYRALRKLRFPLRSLLVDRGAPRRGLEPERLEELRAKCSKLANPLRSWWFRIEDHLVRYAAPDGQEEWYLGAPAREVLTEESVLERYYHASFHQAVPGILTGLGLAATFVAILYALTGLHVTVMNETETITGIKELIEGLSGKFLTSIVGLLLSMIFLLTERKWCERRLTNAFEDLLDTTSELIPTISAARVQLETQAVLARQSAHLSNIEAEILAFREMASMANDSVPRMAETLASDVEQFADKLEQLGFALDQGLRQLSR